MFVCFCVSAVAPTIDGFLAKNYVHMYLCRLNFCIVEKLHTRTYICTYGRSYEGIVGYMLSPNTVSSLVDDVLLPGNTNNNLKYVLFVQLRFFMVDKILL